MEPFSAKAVTLAAVLSTLMSIRGIRRKSLLPSGAIAAWVVGFLAISCGLRGFLLLFFYMVGTKATKYKKEIKGKLDMNALESSIRGPSQVLACSALAVFCSLFHYFHYGHERSIDFKLYPFESKLACAIVSHYATCLADTLASELGILSRHEPVLVTRPWRKVPAGTNGGVTILGFLWSGLGGVLISLVTIAMDIVAGLQIHFLFIILFGFTCGLLGSLLDSILGATIQATYYDKDSKRVSSSGGGTCQLLIGRDILNNAQVNLVSVIILTFFGGWVLGPYLFELLVF